MTNPFFIARCRNFLDCGSPLPPSPSDSLLPEERPFVCDSLTFVKIFNQLVQQQAVGRKAAAGCRSPKRTRQNFGEGYGFDDAQSRGLSRELQSRDREESLRVSFAFAFGGTEGPLERLSGLELKTLEAAQRDVGTRLFRDFELRLKVRQTCQWLCRRSSCRIHRSR